MKNYFNIFYVILLITICDSEQVLKNAWNKYFASPFNSKLYDVEKLWTVDYGEKKLTEYYDYVIVGAGPAGSVLANRLTEDPSVTVLLLEAGKGELPGMTDVPVIGAYFQGTDYDFAYETEVQKKACLGLRDKKCSWPHGKGVGGSTIINYMIYTRGNRRDYDSWSAAGNPGWSYNEILPYYKKSERENLTEFGDNGYHGKRGYLNVEDCPFRSKLVHAYIKSAQDIGFDYRDYNAAEQIGVSYLQANTLNGWRVTSGNSFLFPIKDRPNLTVKTRSWVTKIIINPKTKAAKGVQFSHKKVLYTVKARKEVILSAGAFESAKLLMLSGVGPREHLEELGIPVIKNLPVGETLYEHPGVLGPVFVVKKKIDNLETSENIFNFPTAFEFFSGRGPFTTNSVEGLLYIKTPFAEDPDPGLPDVEIMQAFTTVAFDSTPGTRNSFRLTDETYDGYYKPLQNVRSFQFLPMLLHPRTKGSLKLKSNNPFQHPIFNYNYFDDDRDLEALVYGIRTAIAIASQKPFRDLGVELYDKKVPGCEQHQFNSHEYWRCHVMTLTATFHHQVATCKMGPRNDPTAVVDARLKVYGIKNLRVVDIGIIPTPPSGHTSAFSFMIGEKAADMIKEDNRHNGFNILHRFGRDLSRKAYDWQKDDTDIHDHQKHHAKPISFDARLYSFSEGKVEEMPTKNVTLKSAIRDNILSDIKSILKAGIEEVKSHTNASTEHHSNKTHVAIIVEDMTPSISEDSIKMLTLRNDTKYGKGRGKPRVITLALDKLNATEYNEKDYKLTSNSTVVSVGKNGSMISNITVLPEKVKNITINLNLDLTPSNPKKTDTQSKEWSFFFEEVPSLDTNTSPSVESIMTNSSTEAKSRSKRFDQNSTNALQNEGDKLNPSEQNIILQAVNEYGRTTVDLQCEFFNKMHNYLVKFLKMMNEETPQNVNHKELNLDFNDNLSHQFEDENNPENHKNDIQAYNFLKCLVLDEGCENNRIKRQAMEMKKCRQKRDASFPIDYTIFEKLFSNVMVNVIRIMRSVRSSLRNDNGNTLPFD